MNDELSLSLLPFRVKPLQSLFNGVVKMSANMTANSSTSPEPRQCQLRPLVLENNENISEKCGGDEKDESEESILDNLTRLGINEDFAPYTGLTASADEENNAVVKEEPSANLLPTGLRSAASNPLRIRPPSLSEISFSEGPSKEPEEGESILENSFDLDR